MVRLMVIYKDPPNAAAFDKYYLSTHVPIAKKMPGLRKFELSQGPVASPSGPSGFHLIAELYFDDLAAVQNAFASPEGQAAAADVQVFTTEPPQILIFDSREV